MRMVVVLMLSATLGMHWAVLQGMAWTSMFLKQVQSLPVSVALTNTFDGDHACDWCRVVREGRAEEKSRQETRWMMKLEGVLPPLCQVPVHGQETRDSGMPPVSMVWASRSESPPLPPPRV